jgi:hypothetical protein
LGLVDQLRGLRICLDTAPIIYFIEKSHRYLDIVRPIFLEIDAGKMEAITSTITLLEVLVRPFKTEAPPAERVGSGSPPEGGDYIGKAPLGLFIHHHQILNPVVLLRPFLAHECNCVWFLHPIQLY